MIAYQPLEDRVVVRPIKSAEPAKTAAGIITETIKKETLEAEVLAVGAGRYAPENGQFIPTVLIQGDVVLIGANNGMPLDIPGEDGLNMECKLMREGDVLCLIRKPG